MEKNKFEDLIVSKFGEHPYAEQSEHFLDFAETLVASHEKANYLIQTIFAQLDRKIGKDEKLELSISKKMAARSSTNQNGTPGLDYYLVIVVQEYPPYKTVLEKIKKKLESLVGYKFERTTPYSIQFEFRGFNFDLLPVVSFMTEKALSYKTQLVESLQRIAEANAAALNDGYIFTNLEEFAVEFSLDQNTILMHTIRMAKFWNSMVDFSGIYVPNRSAIIEVVTISSNILIKRWNYGSRRTKSVLTCFARFLLSMANFRHLYVQEYIPWRHHKARTGPRILPFIHDPSNPSNNLAQGISPQVMQIFEAAALRTLQKIDALHLKVENADVKALIDPRN